MDLGNTRRTFTSFHPAFGLMWCKGVTDDEDNLSTNMSLRLEDLGNVLLATRIAGFVRHGQLGAKLPFSVQNSV